MFIGSLLGPGHSAKKLTLVVCPQLLIQLLGEIAKTLTPESCLPRYSVLFHLGYSLDTGIFFKAPQVTAVESRGGGTVFCASSRLTLPLALRRWLLLADMPILQMGKQMLRDVQ